MCLTLLAACSVEPAATDFVPRADLIRFGNVDVQLVDTLGLTEALLPVPDSLAGPFVRGIEPVPSRPRDLVVPWTGGDCDVQTTLTLHRRDPPWSFPSDRSAGRPLGGVLCTVSGRLSAVVVRFRDQPPVVALDLDGRPRPSTPVPSTEALDCGGMVSDACRSIATAALGDGLRLEFGQSVVATRIRPTSVNLCAGVSSVKPKYDVTFVLASPAGEITRTLAQQADGPLIICTY